MPKLRDPSVQWLSAEIVDMMIAPLMYHIMTRPLEPSPALATRTPQTGRTPLQYLQICNEYNICTIFIEPMSHELKRYFIGHWLYQVTSRFTVRLV